MPRLASSELDQLFFQPSLAVTAQHNPTEMEPPALGPEIYGLGFRFNPTPREAVTYYLPRLVSGDPRALHEAVRPVIHRAEVYACEPADLARRFRPMPSTTTHDRFFFASRCNDDDNQAARGGAWSGQTTVVIKDGDGVRIGELRKLRYKMRGGAFTDWLMDEYSSSSSSCGRQFVLCKVYVSPRSPPNSAARRESAAAFFAPLPPPPPPQPAAPTAIVQPAAKRPAPPHAAAMPPCPKRVCLALPPPQRPAPSAPTRLPLATIRVMSMAPPQPCAPRRGSTAPSPTQPPAPAPAPLLSPPVPTRHAMQLHRSPPMPLPTPRRPLAQPKEQVPLPTPPVAMASASHMRQQAPAPASAPPPCPPLVFVVQPKQRMTIVDPFEAAPCHSPPPPPPAATPALQEDDEDEDNWDDLDKELGIQDAAPGLQKEDQDEDEDDWKDLDKELGID